VEPAPPSGRLLGKAKVERCDCLLLWFFDTCSISHVGAVYSAFGILWNFLVSLLSAFPLCCVFPLSELYQSERASERAVVELVVVA